MRLLNIFFAAFTLIFVFSFTNIYAQQTSPKQIKILHNYGHIPFEDGKTTIAEVKFVGFDSDYEQYDEAIGKKIPEKDFLKLLRESKATIDVDDKFQGSKVAKAVKVIKEGLLAYGYLNAEVIAYGEELPKNQMSLIFSVKRNFPAFVSEIRFDGNVNVTGAELVENLKECLDDRKLFDARVYDYFAQKCSRTLLFSKGYFQAKIHSITPHLVSNSYVVEISIDEGIRFVYGTIKFEGAKIFS
jgi:outer membrane protein assembly factor BamA